MLYLPIVPDIKVAYLGGRPENYAQWKDVYSDKGGEYK